MTQLHLFSKTNINKHENDNLANTLDRNCPLRTLEMAFQSIKISKLSGDPPPPPPSDSRLQR